MKTIFVAGAGTDVGKTWASAALIRALLAAGRTVDVFKLVASGYDPANPGESDAGQLLAALGRAPTAEAIDDICPLRFAAPLSPPAAARREGVVLMLDDLTGRAAARMAEARADVLIVEGAGGLMSPLTDDATALDVIASLDTPVMLVGGSYLGAISHLLTAVEVLRTRAMLIEAVVVSESAPPAPDFAETVQDIRRFLGDITLIAARRNDETALAALAASLV